MQPTSRMLTIGFAVLFGLNAAHAAIYTATLSGANESPVNASAGVGTTTVTLDTTAHLLHVIVAFSGLDAVDTAAHIHCCVAPPGVAGVATTTPTFTGFPTGVTSGTFDGTFDTTLAASWNAAFITAQGGTAAAAEAALAAGLTAGQAYLNIHTTLHPGGEIRGFLAAVSPPTIAEIFAPATITVGATTTLTFTLTNPPANGTALTGVAFTDTLPAGLLVSTGSASACGGTLTTTAPGTITLAGGTIAINSQCQFNVTVTGAAAGNFSNPTGNINSTEGGAGGAASAGLAVVAQPVIPIPLLTSLGLALLAALLSIATLRYMRKRRG